MEKGIEIENTEIHALMYDIILAKKKKIVKQYKNDVFMHHKNMTDTNTQKYLSNIYDTSNIINVLARDRNNNLKKYQVYLNDRYDYIQKKNSSFQYNNSNKYEKEKMLFFEHERLRIQLLNLITHNITALMSFIPTTKYLRKIRKEPKLLKKYFVDTKSLDKSFVSTNPVQVKDPKMLEIIQNSRLYFLNRKMCNKVHANDDVANIPYIILREVTKIVNSICYIHSIECIANNISKELKKCYINIKWGSIFLNKVSKNILPLTEYILEEIAMYSSKISTNTVYNVLYGTTTESIYVNLLTSKWIYTQIQYNYLIKNNITNASSVSYTKTDKELYVSIYLILYKECIQMMHKRRIVDYFMPYVSMMSKQYMKNGYGSQISDLIQEGTLGIMDAIDRFQIGRGARFLTYAYWWMHRHMVKTRIKKTKTVVVRVKPDVQIKTQSKLMARIKVLYDKIMKKEKKKKNATKKRVRYREQISYMLHIKRNITEHNILDVYTKLYSSIEYKDFVICSLYFGIPPYKRHNIEQISKIFDVTNKEVFKYIKKIQKYVMRAYKRARSARL